MPLCRPFLPAVLAGAYGAGKTKEHEHEKAQKYPRKNKKIGEYYEFAL